MYNLIPLITLLPLLGFAFLSIFGRKIPSEKFIGTLATTLVGIPFLIALSVLFTMIGLPETERATVVHLFTWIEAGPFVVDYAYQIDQLSILFTLIITGIGTLIHLYSMGYMHGDRSFYRFFAYLNLFIFMMLNLVLANNFLVTFLGWEGVGLASYLLIGFWYDRKFEGTQITWTGDAAKKAFIVNRIGDFGMLVAMFIAFYFFGTLDYDAINAGVLSAKAGGVFPEGTVYSDTIITVMALMIFLGCTGKSAQFPLYVWLPDAMAGPTPVSALIHAATMVTSGIFLLARTSSVISASPEAMSVIAIVGVLTAFFAATMGLVQNDIKKVLAYSTVSQLGFMFAALGVGAWVAAVFHVMTHAFFKACLFLGSGSVIHGMHEEQDIQKMGNLKKYMPITYLTFIISSFAIAGVFPLSGFFSKDEILWFAFDKGSPIMWAVLVAAAFFTAFYMFRLVNLTFNGKERFDAHHVHPHESPATMTIPLIVLAFLAVVGGFIGIPHPIGHPFHIPNVLEHWLDPIFAGANAQLGYVPPTELHAIEYVLIVASLTIGLVGIFLGYKLYYNYANAADEPMKKLGGLHTLLWNKYFVDEAYHNAVVSPLDNTSRSFLWKVFDVKIIDGIVNGTAKLVGMVAEVIRKVQTGIIQNYAAFMVGGLVIMLFWLLLV